MDGGICDVLLTESGQHLLHLMWFFHAHCMRNTTLFFSCLVNAAVHWGCQGQQALPGCCRLLSPSRTV